MTKLPLQPHQMISYFPIADANNTVRVLLTVAKPGTSLQMWYTSVERLTRQNPNAPWEHVPGTAEGHADEAGAIARATALYTGGWRQWA